MGILDRIAGRFDELVGTEGEVRAAEPDELAEARELASRGDDERAAEAFGSAANKNTNMAEAWLGLGEALARLGRFEPARDAYRRALTLPLSTDDRPRAQAGLGRLYSRAEQWGKAIRELRKAADALAEDAEVLSALGRALVAADEPEGADWLARAARLPGGSVDLLIEAARAKTDADAALRLLREAVSRAPDNASARAALARHLVAMAKRDAASESRDSTSSAPHPHLAATLAEGLEEARAAIAARPDDGLGWCVLREVHAAAGDYPAAMIAARREAACGSTPSFSAWLALALGAQDRAAVEEALSHGQESDAGFAEARAFIGGTIDDGALAALARLAPGTAARQFVVRSFAPPPPPLKNLYGLLTWAETLAGRHSVLFSLAVPMARAVEAFDRPLLVAVMGEFNAGKSSFVNALVGQAIAPVGVTPTTATINILRHGPGGGRAIYHDGMVRTMRGDQVAGFLGALDDAAAAAIRQVEIFAPVETLRRVEIVDTPGLNSLRSAHEKTARDFLVEADAIVWVFAAGLAAKATEREALTLARAAGKRVLGVLNKVDRASPEEIGAVVRHVGAQLQDLVGRVVPLSARAALEARVRGDATALEASGFPQVEAALEEDFFAQARQLKRATAMAALRRFGAEAAAAAATATAMPWGVGGAPLSDDAESGATARRTIDTAERELRSAVAAERVALRARLEENIRATALEVRDFVRPRGWLFGEHSADPRDEAFLRDLLDDGVVAATTKTRGVLVAALPAAGGIPRTAHGADAVADVAAAIDDAVERFRAYARGIIEGAAAVFFRVDLQRLRLDLGAIRNALGRWSPDPEEALFRPLDRAIGNFATRARADLDERSRTSEIADLMRREHLLLPLAALEEAVADLANPSPGDHSP